MNEPTIHGKRRTLTASLVRQAIASDLNQIKSEDKLTFAEIGRVLGKSDDQAAKYCDGTASMCAETYAFARACWNGRFTGTLDALIEGPKGKTNDRSKCTAITKALLELSVALENDDWADPNEVRGARKSLEEAKLALDEFLSRLTPRAA